MYFIDKTNKASRSINSRRGDFAHLEKEAKTNPDPGARRMAHKALSQLKNERHDGKMLSMRQALINAHRSNNHEEIKDITDYVSKKKKYKHE